jgi:hypothetical protein
VPLPNRQGPIFAVPTQFSFAACILEIALTVLFLLDPVHLHIFHLLILEPDNSVL